MSEPSAPGIEGVQWVAGTGETVTVRVQGRPRAEALRGVEPSLVIEAAGAVHHFAAIPEAAKPGDAPSGTWQVSFSIPSSLAPPAGTMAWLALGGDVVLPLPAPSAGDAGRRVQREAHGTEEGATAVASAVQVGEASGEQRGASQLDPARTSRAIAQLMREELELRRLAVRPPVPRRDDDKHSPVRAPQPELLDCERGLVEERVQSGRRIAALERELREHRARSGGAYEAIAELRQELDALWSLATVPPEKTVGSPSSADELELVPARRSRTAVESPSPPRAAQTGRRARPPTSRWLERALQRLARRSPTLAGRLLVVLLPGAEMHQEHLVSLLAAGRVQRRIRRVGGEAASSAALERMLATPTSIADLRLEPGLSFALAAVMIEPRWTAGSRFTIAYELPGGRRPGPYLGVHDGLPVTVTDTPEHGEVTTTIRCPADAMTAVLAGEPVAGTEILGQERPLELIRLWLERAQSG